MEQVLANQRIFYIEDDPQNREIVGTILQESGAAVEFDAWAFPELTVIKLKAFHPHLILLDLMLPHGVSGYEIYDAIRRAKTFKRVPVVITSAADATVEIPRARAKGINGYLVKPINVMRFPSQIAHILAGKALWVDS